MEVSAKAVLVVCQSCGATLLDTCTACPKCYASAELLPILTFQCVTLDMASALLKFVDGWLLKRRYTGARLRQTDKGYEITAHAPVRQDGPGNPKS